MSDTDTAGTLPEWFDPQTLGDLAGAQWRWAAQLMALESAWLSACWLAQGELLKPAWSSAQAAWPLAWTAWPLWNPGAEQLA